MVTLKLNESSYNPIVRSIIFLAATLRLESLTFLEKEMGGGEIHEMIIRPSEVGSANRASALLAQPVVSQTIGAAFIPLHSHPSATYHTDMNTRQGMCDT
jgi:hypothetical protein